MDHRTRTAGQGLPDMSLVMKWMAGIAGLAVAALILGFLLFANHVTREPIPVTTRADGIVVLTGEGFRIKEGVRLLNEGRAGKLLISGVNPKISAAQLGRLTGLSETQFNCCVTLGYQAMTTLGNASETLNWARSRDLDSLIIVTSSYHMPRSLAELSLAMPQTRLIPHEVLPDQFRNRVWWLNFDAVRVLASEYLKFIPSIARLGVKRASQGWNTASHAVDTTSPLE